MGSFLNNLHLFASYLSFFLFVYDWKNKNKLLIACKSFFLCRENAEGNKQMPEIISDTVSRYARALATSRDRIQPWVSERLHYLDPQCEENLKTITLEKGVKSGDS